MIIYDISMAIEKDMAVYKNLEEKKPIIAFQKKMPKDSINESTIFMNLHTGTHIDAPYHVDEDGATIESTDLSKLVRKCRVLDLTEVSSQITKDDLVNKKIQPGEFILFKTKNSFTEEFKSDYVYVEKSAAEYMAQKEITGVGIDSLGIERNQPNHDSHKALFNKGIIIMEGLRLKEVEEGGYLLCALPLKIKGVDGSPMRAILIKDLIVNCPFSIFN